MKISIIQWKRVTARKQHTDGQRDRERKRDNRCSFVIRGIFIIHNERMRLLVSAAARLSMMKSGLIVQIEYSIRVFVWACANTYTNKTVKYV